MTRKDVWALASGFLFAIGLGLGGMTQPARVTGFLDLFGAWDPSLLFVMGGAVIVHMPVALWMRRQLAAAPAGGCGVPVGGASARLGDPRLLGGAALFGVGWGLSGYCPGPALAAVGALRASGMVFFLGMASTMMAYEWLRARQGAVRDPALG